MARRARGPGRPPLDPAGSVELRVRVTQAQAAKLERLAREMGFVDAREVPILAAAARLIIDER